MNKKIQLIRASCIICVILGHTVNGIQAVITRPVINFCVAMFIFLSGYLTKMEIPNLKDFYFKRISKVAIPYVIWTVIYSLLFWGGFKKFMVDLLTARAGIQFYYIFVYIQLVLLTPLVIKLLKSKYNWIGWFITPVFIIVASYICYFNGINIRTFKKTIFLSWFIYYYLGMAIKNKIINYHISEKKTMILYIISLLCCLSEAFAWYYLDNNLDMATTQLKLSSILVAISAEFLGYIFITSDKITINDTKLTRFLIMIGDSAFGIYFSHYAIIRLLNMIPGYSSLMFFPLNSIITFIISLILILICRKFLSPKILGYLAFGTPNKKTESQIKKSCN